ncbi:MAG: 5-formyltetrahydrofolate cyclo-ligase [Treponema sp.]|nr:5-formyltetrahydrofolate cyclo-ligase [Treponema sp.]
MAQSDWLPRREQDLVDLTEKSAQWLGDTARQTAFGWTTAACTNEQLSKETLRADIRRRISALAPEELTLRGGRTAVRLSAQDIWRAYPVLLIFISTSWEIDTGPLLEAALAGGKTVFAPRIEAGNRLGFYRVGSVDGPWRCGPFGIREPGATAGRDSGPGERFVPGDDPWLVLLPGLAFDRAGNRLGHGGGFYDRFLDETGRDCPRRFCVGFCADFQVLPAIPADPWDRPVDAVCTEEDFFSVTCPYPERGVPGRGPRPHSGVPAGGAPDRPPA